MLSRMQRLRLGLVLLLVIGLFVLGHYGGVAEWLSLPYLRARVAAAGPAGAVLFGAALILVVLLHLPAAPIIVTAILVYGRLWGAALCWASGLLAVSLTFALARGAGGQLLIMSRPGSDTALPTERPLWRRLLAHLHDRPVRSVVLLRAVFALAPPLNFALALTGLRYRDYLLGSALGLLVPLTYVSLGVDWIARLLGVS